MRTHECANQHRFRTYEVLGPIYRRDPAMRDATIETATRRAQRYARDVEIAKALATMSQQEAAAAFGVSKRTAQRASKRRPR